MLLAKIILTIFLTIMTPLFVCSTILGLIIALPIRTYKETYSFLKKHIIQINNLK